jgi:hypothetical protein
MHVSDRTTGNAGELRRPDFIFRYFHNLVGIRYLLLLSQKQKVEKLLWSGWNLWRAIYFCLLILFWLFFTCHIRFWSLKYDNSQFQWILYQILLQKWVSISLIWKIFLSLLLIFSKTPIQAQPIFYQKMKCKARLINWLTLLIIHKSILESQ